MRCTSQGAGSFSGGAVGNPDNWRKMHLVRAFTEAELKLLGSSWKFMHPGGEFEVEFHADAYNHFVCTSFPAHSHWSLAGDVVYINWGKYGEYGLRLSPDGTRMDGERVSARGAACTRVCMRASTRVSESVRAAEIGRAHV